MSNTSATAAEQNHSSMTDVKFNNINLDDDSVTDGSTADVEDEQNELITNTANRRKKKLRRKKIHFRSDFVDEVSSSDEEEFVQVKQNFKILETEPVSTIYHFVFIFTIDIFVYYILNNSYTVVFFSFF